MRLICIIDVPEAGPRLKWIRWISHALKLSGTDQMKLVAVRDADGTTWTRED